MPHRSAHPVLLALLLSGAVFTARAGNAGKTPGIDSPRPTAPGVFDFLFSHHFQVVGEAHKVINSPTFHLELGILPGLAVGTEYATSSDVGPRVNEFQPYVKWAVLTQKGSGWLDLTAIAGFNTGASSVDGALVLSRRLGPLTLLASPRVFSNGYDAMGPTFAGSLGLRLSVTSKISVVGDVSRVLAARDLGTAPASPNRIGWSAGLAFGIPYSPHAISLFVTNRNTLSLEGESRGTRALRVGFEFDIPIHLARFGALFHRAPKTPAAAPPPSRAHVTVKITGFAFEPATLTVTPGTTVEWVNEDQVPHTATADDGRWDSGTIPPGGHWSHRFDSPGRHPYFCTVHPFMKATMVVRGK